MIKKESSPALFNQISASYDRLNRVLSLGLDRYWRACLSRELSRREHLQVLDCATGTGDQLFSLMKRKNIQFGVGIDLAEEMLKKANEKKKLSPQKDRIAFTSGSFLSIPYPDQSFDAVSISFGLRNTDSIEKALAEMFRVLKPGGEFLSLEFSKPKNRWIEKGHALYTKKFLIPVGRLLSKHHQAYTYLHNTIQSFHSPEKVLLLLKEAGFTSTTCRPLLFGTVSLYKGIKKD